MEGGSIHHQHLPYLRVKIRLILDVHQYCVRIHAVLRVVVNHRGNPDRTSHFHTIGYFREDAVRLIRMFAMHTKKDGLLFPPVEVERVVCFSLFG